MALNWQWKDKCGEINLVQGEKHYTLSLYQGNAYLIMLHEYTDTVDGETADVYDLFGFFNDKYHMKNCLGLNKKGGYTSNIYEMPNQRFTKLRINKAKYQYTKELVAAFVEAFENIEIEVYTKEEAG